MSADADHHQDVFLAANSTVYIRYLGIIREFGVARDWIDQASDRNGLGRINFLGCAMANKDWIAVAPSHRWNVKRCHDFQSSTPSRAL